MQNDAFVSGHVVANPGPLAGDGTGDFNDDGHTDVLLQNDNGDVAVWEMNGSGQISQSGEVANPGPNWHVEGTGDFNQDGKSDIVLQNNNGSVAIWDMNGDSQPVRRSRQSRPQLACRRNGRLLRRRQDRHSVAE